MAGGIDWFRWHHGSVTDPKFQLVARKAGARLGDVITVWAFVLEKASADADRGAIGELDFETLDFLLGADEGTAVRILDAMTARGLIAGSRIAKWEERQPKREREDNTAAERKRQQRAREAGEDNVTPCHAMSRQETPREEKSREDKTLEPNGSVNSAAKATELDLVGDMAGDRKVTPKSGESITVPQCPVGTIVNLYHEHMPENPRIRVLDDARKKAIAARWKQAAKLECKPFGYATQADGIAAWTKFFQVCAQSDFLTGKAKPQPGKPPFLADIDFLMSPSGFKSCLENKYHREAA